MVVLYSYAAFYKKLLKIIPELTNHGCYSSNYPRTSMYSIHMDQFVSGQRMSVLLIVTTWQEQAYEETFLVAEMCCFLLTQLS